MTSESCSENIRIGPTNDKVYSVKHFTEPQFISSDIARHTAKKIRNRILTLELRNYLKTMKMTLGLRKCGTIEVKKIQHNSHCALALRSSLIMDLLRVPRTDTSFGLRRFSVAGPRIWNGLPHELREDNTLPCFKSHLRTYYFRHHMDN